MSAKDEIRSLSDLVAEQDRQSRVKYHLTLDSVISFMRLMKGGIPVRMLSPFETESYILGSPISFCEYPSDLAFQYRKPGDGEDLTVGEFRDMCKKCIGQKYVGHKGGTFVMDGDTPLWAWNPDTFGGLALVYAHLVNRKLVILTKMVNIIA